MNTAIEDVQAQILRMVEKSTFTAEAAEGIAKLRIDLEHAVEHNQSLNESIKTVRAANAVLQSQIDEAQRKETTLEMRTSAVMKREAQMSELEKSVAVAQGKEQVFRECFSNVFRNFEFHKAIMNSVAVPGPGGGYTTAPTSGSESTRVA